MATQIVELTGDEAALLSSLDKVIQKQLEHERRLRDTAEQGDAAGVTIRDAMAKVTAESDKALNGLLRDMKSLGPEGATAAAALREHFQTAGKAGHKSFDQVLAQIKAIDPEAAAAAESAARELADAANSSEAQFKQMLDELRSLGPEGRQAATELKRELVAAGKISERSMQDIVGELEKLDPAASASARKIIAEMDRAGKSGKDAFASFGKSAIGEITSIVTAYIGVQEAIQAVNGYLETQREILAETRDTQLQLATAQQEAAKNLAGLTVVERNDLLRNAVPDIAAASGFSDVAEITQALGAVASAGESNAELIKNAVQQAARIERLTPERLDSTAAAASAVQRQAGLDDIRQAIALVETTGTQARITDPKQLVASLPRAVGSLTATVPQQNPEEAARQAAALFAQITQGGNDEQGTSSATFAIDFGSRLDKFFTDLSDNQVNARSRVELIDRQIAKGTDTEQNRLERDRLLEFLQASQGLQDPATLFGRLEALQGNEALQRQFVGQGFGEKQFQTALNSLLQPTSDLAQALKQSFDTIQADTAFFEREAEALRGETPQLRTAAAEADYQAAIQALEVSDEEGATLKEVREIVSGVLRKTSRGGFAGVVESAFDFTSRGSLSGSTAAEEAVSGIEVLRRRADDLAREGSPGSDERIMVIEDQINNLLDYLGNQVASGSLDEGGVARARSRVGRLANPNPNRSFADSTAAPATEAQIELSRQILAALERIAESNEATADNTAPTPPPPMAAAPALSNVAP